ncbi:hypothetical protein [Propionibacterium freudenreichii]|nr:hypothetical protein [Propionibacterium freudenreichii]
MPTTSAMKDGRVAAFGPSDEIMDSAVLTEVFDTPVDVVQGPHGPLAVYY